METTKSIFKSKTFWVNIIAGVLGILTIVTPDWLSGLGIGADQQTKVLTVIGGVTSVLNIALRFISNTPITPLTK